MNSIKLFKQFSINNLRLFSTKILTSQTIPQNLTKLQYDVRNTVMIRGLEYRDMIKANIKLPFNKIINCSSANPLAIWQHPNSFFRQVSSLVNYPELAKDPYISENKDVVERANKIINEIPGGLGSYSLPFGMEFIRKEIANFIMKRDQCALDYHDIYLTNGVSNGIVSILSLLISDPNDVVLIPNPGYPLYKSAITLLNGGHGTYNIGHHHQTIDIDEMHNVVQIHRMNGHRVRAIIVTNPGNPVGYLLSTKEISDIVDYCNEENITILSDEVLQDYTYNGDAFASFRSVASQKSDTNISLFSFHSVSKGYYGECGRRGGYVDLFNIPQDIHHLLYKHLSLDYCTNMGGQLAMSLYFNPPKKTDESFEENDLEMRHIERSLQRKVKSLENASKKIPGLTFSKVSGGLFCFVTIDMPQKAIKAARDKEMSPEIFYSLKLLSQTGILVQPGYIYKDEDDNKYNFRLTLLPEEPDYDLMLGLLENFQNEFMKKYN